VLQTDTEEDISVVI